MAEKVRHEPSIAVRLLQPAPLVLLTSQFRADSNVMTVAWAMPVSLDPPLVAVAIHPDRLSHEYVSRSEFFALNIPNMDLLPAIHRCGLESGRDGDKFIAAGLTPGDAHELDLPLVDECVAHIECGVVDRARFGDHDLFIGEPLAVTALDEAFDERWLVDSDAGRIVHHLRADYYAGVSRSYRARLAEEDLG
jgi:flavin reductase (DIM6/NTAB) family NADH-FMN oxidoreductase RutF